MKPKNWIQKVLDEASEEVKNWPPAYQRKTARTGMIVWKPFKKK